ncbi:hypothetical protein V1499_14230 [Neobacillus sp. SCS-31]|uniref:hypothetical protein n=1 Tax=Neobacillus oceani TaxID=3115292 RepID=UPI003905F7CF
MLINEENAKRLVVDQLIQEIDSKDSSLSKLKKPELIERFLETIAANEVAERRILKKYPEAFALHPSTLEEFLGITRAERLRWTEESKFKIVYYESFTKWGKTLHYPMYDYYEAFRLKRDGNVAKWRNTRMAKLKEKRSRATKMAVGTRKANESIAKKFYEEHWGNLLAQWYKEDAVIGATLQLAFWTMWVNRYAKEMQVKEKRARKKQVEYMERKEKFYQLKNEPLCNCRNPR